MFIPCLIYSSIGVQEPDVLKGRPSADLRYRADPYDQTVQTALDNLEGTHYPKQERTAATIKILAVSYQSSKAVIFALGRPMLDSNLS